MFDTLLVDVEVTDPWWVEDHAAILELTREAWAAEDVEFGGYDGVPGCLGDLAPGPMLGALLGMVDRSRLNGHDLVVVMVARARQLAHDQAQLYGDMVEVAHCPPGGPAASVERDQVPVEYAADEIRAALTLTRRAAEAELALAWQVTDRLPAVGDALAAGMIDRGRARVLCEATGHLPQHLAREVAATVLSDAPQLTTGQLAARLRRLCISVDPDDATGRYTSGLGDRRVVAEPNDDGTAYLAGYQLPPDRVTAIRNRIEYLARQAKTSNDPRTLDQIRADVYLDLLQGTLPHHTGTRAAIVDITIDLATLLGLNDSPAEIPGWGPVIADIARQALTHHQNGEWRITVTDPDTRAVLWNGITRRRPTTNQQRWIHTRRPTCIFPGCRMPATQSDIDHTTPHSQGGPTTTANNHPLCRHDHCTHHAGWHYTQTTPNTYTWTSPLGHTYTTTTRAPP